MSILTCGFSSVISRETRSAGNMATHAYFLVFLSEADTGFTIFEGAGYFFFIIAKAGYDADTCYYDAPHLFSPVYFL